MGGAGELIQNRKFRVGVTDQAVTLNGRFTQWVFNGAAPTNWTLPILSGTENYFLIKNRGSANLTILPTGTEELYTDMPEGSLVLLPGDSWALTNDKSYWLVNQ